MSGSFRDYKGMDVWSESRNLCNIIYTITKAFPKEELFGLTNQIRRAAVSVPSNIAEGFGRKSKPQHNQFLRIALGSMFELETQLIIANDQKFISDESLSDLLKKVDSVKRLINGTIRYNNS